MNIKIGQKFGEWTVLEKIDRRKYKCQCKCGKIKEVRAIDMSLGKSTKCVNCASRIAKTKHGMSLSKFYQIWSSMIARCTNPNSTAFKNYGGRGITVSEEWLKFDNFKNDMLKEYKEGLEIDRIDVNGSYCRENCRWVSRSINTHNRRKLGNCSSKYIGVVHHNNVWEARIKNNNILFYIGGFKTQEEAAKAYDDKSEEIYGDRPNKTI